MLAIRLQRTGRKGHAQYRVVVQESRLTPTSGRVVYRLGNYDPHAKVLNIDKEKAGFYLSHGAQPSDRVARLLKNNDVKLPAWVAISQPIERKLRNPDKLRKNRPEEPKEEPKEDSPVAEAPSEETPAEEAPKQEAPAPEAAAEKVEKPAEEVQKDEKPKDEKADEPDEPAAQK